MISPVSSVARSDLFAAPREGIQRGIAKMGETAQSIAEGEVTPENMVGLIEAKMLVKANAVVMRAADEMLGTLLDEKA